MHLLSETDEPESLVTADSEDTIAFRSEQIDTGHGSRGSSTRTAPLPSSSSPTPRWDRAALILHAGPARPAVAQIKEMFKGALENVGVCSVPVTSLVLGGWFWDRESKPKSTHIASSARSKAAKETYNSCIAESPLADASW
ncbi:hypothetical protein OG21DRAFT_1496585 [Imleria badia]|nr:hypothetical protein OG21DRAFT_1496585 [Imleria badia]